MSIENERPETLSEETVAEDLWLSNEEGSSWFIYYYNQDSGKIEADLYNEEGAVVKSFNVSLVVEEMPLTPER